LSIYLIDDSLKSFVSDVTRKHPAYSI
jgi:hypothetical protein